MHHALRAPRAPAHRRNRAHDGCARRTLGEEMAVRGREQARDRRGAAGLAPRSGADVANRVAAETRALICWPSSGLQSTPWGGRQCIDRNTRMAPRRSTVRRVKLGATLQGR
eukprot:350564-Chlamydomonas_euryale.AAC.3